MESKIMNESDFQKLKDIEKKVMKAGFAFMHYG